MICILPRLIFTFASLFIIAAAELVGADLTHDRVLDANRLIDIAITIPRDDWLKLCMQNRDPAKAISGIPEEPFTYFKADIVIDGVAVPSVAIRKKGFLGSTDSVFPSLKVKFDEYVKQVPVDGLDGLTLNNNKQDSSLLSQYLAYYLFNKAGVHAPRCSFVKLTVNGEYLGIYSNVESISKPFLTRRFGDGSGNLYEGALADFYTKSIDRIEVKSNKQNHDFSKAKLLASATTKEGSDGVREIEQLIDVDNFLRYWAIESLIGFWDGYTNNQNNFWVYENPKTKKFFFMPWGADMAFMQSGFPPFGSRGPASVYANSMVAHRLFRDQAISNRYRETMVRILNEVWIEDELIQQVDRYEELLSSDLHFRQKGAPRAMKSIRQFVNGRRKVLEKDLEKWPPEVATQPRKPTYLTEIGFIKGSFQTQWNESPRKKKEKNDSIDLRLKMGDEETAVKNTGISIHRPAQNSMMMPFPAPAPPLAKGELMLTCTRESDGKQLTIVVPFDPKKMSSNLDMPVQVLGVFSDGQSGPGFFPNFNRRSVAGTITFSKANFDTQGVIEGELNFVISESRGGLFARPEPK